MKKAITLILALLLMLSVVACSGSDNGSGGSGSADKEEVAATEGSAAKTLADETTAVSLSFTPPKGYDTVNCHIEKKADGTIVDKSFTYTFADESEVDIGYTKGKQITDEIPQSYLDKAESAEYAGKPFSIITEGKTIMSLCQDGDVIYGVGYTFADEIDKDAFEKLMKGISITEKDEVVEIDEDLFDINYTLDKSLNQVAVSSSRTEKPDGTLVDKSLIWFYGKDYDNVDFRLMIKVYKNTTVEKELPKDYRTEKVEIGGVTYTAIYDTDTSESPFAYYTQQGDDVYQIRNMGVSSSWSTKRSDESYAALKNLMNTVSFK